KARTRSYDSMVYVTTARETGAQRYNHLVLFFNDTATTEIYTLSLPDALPISKHSQTHTHRDTHTEPEKADGKLGRSEEHTSELQSHLNLVCRLLLENKNT